MSEHKYIKDIDKLECDCFPDKSFNSTDTLAFRWVHSDFNNPNNFLPVFKIDPNRVEDYENCNQKCMGYGLSLYSNLSKAEKKLTSYLKRKPQLVKVFGDSIAEGKLEKDDGIANKPDSKSHFTFHEHKDCNLKTKFATIKQVKL